MSKTAKETEFIKSANIHMTEFEINGFKRTYPSLFKTIMDAMEAYHTAKLEEKDAEISTLKAEIEVRESSHKEVDKLFREWQVLANTLQGENDKLKAEIERLKDINIKTSGCEHDWRRMVEITANIDECRKCGIQRSNYLP